MRVLITGSSGLIGSACVSHLAAQGHSLTRLVRSKHFSSQPEISWNPVARIVESRLLENFDAAIHLAGDPIASGRWTPEKKASIRDSRVKGTRFLCESLAKAQKPPRVLLCASAVGIYGDRGEETLTEESPRGEGFLAEVGEEWEKACEAAALKGIRVVHSRFGIVLSPQAGALKMMLPAFQLGLGGRLGTGKQWMSWISIEDVAPALLHLLATESFRGPVNLVAPHPVTNEQFTKTLGRVLQRPTLLSVPAPAVRLLFGELADEALLASTRVEPERLKVGGFRFSYPDLEEALRRLLTPSRG